MENNTRWIFCLFFCITFVYAESDKLKGFAYNPYGTLGTSPTVADIVATPSDIYGQRFVYVSPIDYLGYSAFDLAGGSVLLGFGNMGEGSLGKLTLGYAQNSWGLSLDFAFNKDWEKYSSYDDFERHTYAGDYIGANFSMPFGKSTLYLRADWVTDSDERSSEYYQEGSTKSTCIGITGGENLVWDARLGFVNRGTREENRKYIFNNIYSSFDLGYKVLRSDKIKITAGLGNRFYWQILKIKHEIYEWYDEGYQHFLTFYVAPNILGEVFLTKHLLAFVGTSTSISFSTYLFSDEHYLFFLRNNFSNSYIGLRYEHETWAVETRLQNNVIGELFDKNNPLISLGGFIYF